MATFQVDLRGMVDLLSRNLYSGPRVYVRELLQNTVDAIAARRQQEPDCPTQVTITIDGATLTCRDTGIGLTLEEAASLLSTIGASSKRDELGFSRADYLGQFGIGMLSCFMVCGEILVHTRSARQAEAPTVEWRGRTDGTYEVHALDPQDPNCLDAPGTSVKLVGLPGEPWLQPDTVRSLIDEFAALLPIDVQVSAGQSITRHAHQQAPWELTRREQLQWCAEHLGAEPFDIIDLHVPAAGLKGIAVVTASAHPTATAHHTAYVKRMLVSRSAEGLAPAWAYFVRVVADAAHLRLTASREQLMDDDLRGQTSEAIGQAVRTWLERLAQTTPGRFAQFVAAHAVGLRSVAISDPEMLELVVRHAPLETTSGPRSLAQLAASGEKVRYTRTVDQYQGLADVANSQGMVLVNAGYAYEEEVISAFLSRSDLLDAATDIALVDPGELLDAFSPCSPAEEAEAMDILMVAAQAIDPEDCEVVMRRFEPATLPALYLPDPDLAGRLAARNSSKAATGVWSQVLGVTDPFAGAHVPRLVLNRTNPLVVRLVAARAQDAVVTRTLRGLYIQCLLQSRQPLGAKERAWAAETLGSLLDSALPDLL